MSHYRVGCDAHKYYSLFAVLDDRGKLQEEQRVNHKPGAIRDYLSAFPEGTPVALESVGNGHIPAISGLVLDRRRDRSRRMHT
jgi:hypothetical protein